MNLALYTMLTLNLWEIQDYSDDDPMTDCYYCSALLYPRVDYSCALCGREACDNCSEACQSEQDCDVGVTCYSCVESHWLGHSSTKNERNRTKEC